MGLTLSLNTNPLVNRFAEPGRPDRHGGAGAEGARPAADARVHQPELAGAGDPAADPGDGGGAAADRGAGDVAG